LHDNRCEKFKIDPTRGHARLDTVCLYSVIAFESDEVSIAISFHLASYNQRNIIPLTKDFSFVDLTCNKNAKRNMVIHWFAADESGGVSWAFEPMGIHRLAKNTFWITQ